MSFEERALKAVELRQNGYNCCQAVAAALADLTSLTEDQLMQIASGFALGIGNMEGTCGALVGAAIAAGLAAKGRGLQNRPGRYDSRPGRIERKADGNRGRIERAKGRLSNRHGHHEAREGRSKAGGSADPRPGKPNRKP